MKATIKSFANRAGCIFAAGCLAFVGVPAGAFTDIAAAATQEESSFTVGACTYAVDSGSTVTITQVSTAAGGEFAVPQQVTSPVTGTSYTVTAFNPSAFQNCPNITSITIPASVGYVASGVNQYFTFYRCASLTAINVESGNAAFSSVDGVLFTADGSALLAYPQAKTPASYSIPEDVHSIYHYAFYGNAHLKTVSFSSDLTGTAVEGDGSSVTRGGIGESAFRNCTALEELDFPDDAELGYVSLSSTGLGTRGAIDARAFMGCTSLKEVSLPPVTTTKIKGDYYNANATTLKDFTSGYMAYWHNGDGPVQQPALGDSVFSGCTSLKTVTFEAGSETGMYAYYISGSSVFAGCSKLEAVVFEDTEAYWTDPDKAYSNGAQVDYWDSDHCNIDVPTLYYAVDYYGSQSAAQSDDSYASKRLARVEYAANTPVVSIATNASGLSSYTCDASLYAQTSADGTAPSAAAAAGHAGESGWVWMLSGGQSAREALSDSCYAYPVKANSLAAGRVVSEQTDAMRAIIDRHLGTQFDPERYYNDTGSRYAYTFSHDGTALAVSDNGCWFVLDSTGARLESLKVYAADGSLLDASDYTMTAQAYSKSTGKLSSTEIEANGPYLLTFTPKAGSGYDTSTSISQWVLVKAHKGDVQENYGSNAAATSYAANHVESATDGYHYGAPYVVMVGKGDTTSALLAAGYAGVVGGGIQVTASRTSVGSNNMIASALNGAHSQKVMAFGTADYLDPKLDTGYATYRLGYDDEYSASELAVEIYAAFSDSDNFESYFGYDPEDEDYTGTRYAWSSTAVLASPSATLDTSAIAAYAYATKSLIFFTEEDGSVSKSTWNCLKDFAHVVVAGDESAISASTLTDLAARAAEAGVSQGVSRFESDEGDACAYSLAVASELIENELIAASDVAIVDGRDATDFAAALSYTGYKQGLTLISTSIADSKRIVRFLSEYADEIDRVALFGRNADVMSSKAFTLADELANLWDSSSVGNIEKATTLAVGDTAVIHGNEYSIGAGNTLQATGTAYAGCKPVAKGKSFELQGAAYTTANAGIGAATVKLSKTSYTYTGKACKPGVTVTFDGAKLKAGTDYALSYSNNKNAGKASVKITGKGDYAGTFSVAFAIAKAKQTIKGASSFSVNTKAKARTVKLGASAKTQLSYTLSKAAKKAGLKVSKAGKVTVKKGTKKGSYAITVAAKATTNYKAAKKTVKIKVS